MSEVEAFLGLGSNLGDRAGRIGEALERLSGCDGIGAVHPSGLYETSPVGGPEQPWYLNAAAGVSTSLEPQALLEACLRIERDMGRVRAVPNGPREIDLDVLLYGQRVVISPDLVIPHAAMTGRLFVLAPLAEIAGDVTHPVEKVRIAELLARLGASGGAEVVRRFSGPALSVRHRR